MKSGFPSLWLVLILLVGVLIAPSGELGAQEEEKSPNLLGPRTKTRILYKKRTVIDLDESVIEGELIDTRGTTDIIAPLDRNFDDLMRLRKDFKDEFRQDAHNIR